MKYYAVKKGRKPGIYNSWEECEKQIKHFSGAKFKKFDTYDEAYSFIHGVKKTEDWNLLNSISEDPSLPTCAAYIDGSYSQVLQQYSFGCVLLENDQIIDELYGRACEEDSVEMRNVAGELLGAVTAVQYAINNGFKILLIHYDYEGIEKWAKKEWRANKKATAAYQEFMCQAMEKIQIHFIKVKAHSGVAYNERADALAKKALGI